MAYSSAELLDAMATAERLTCPALRVDGGAAANDWLMQFQADVLGIPVERPDLVETTALGAAGLAGIRTGKAAGGGIDIGDAGGDEVGVGGKLPGEEGCELVLEDGRCHFRLLFAYT